MKNGKEECNRRTEKSPPQAKKKMSCICIVQKSDERKEERKRGTKYERKSLKSGKEERMGTEKSEEQKRGTQEERKSLKNGKEECNRRTEKSPPQAKKKMNCICTKP